MNGKTPRCEKWLTTARGQRWRRQMWKQELQQQWWTDTCLKRPAGRAAAGRDRITEMPTTWTASGGNVRRQGGKGQVCTYSRRQSQVCKQSLKEEMNFRALCGTHPLTSTNFCLNRFCWTTQKLILRIQISLWTMHRQVNFMSSLRTKQYKTLLPLFSSNACVLWRQRSHSSRVSEAIWQATGYHRTCTEVYSHQLHLPRVHTNLTGEVLHVMVSVLGTETKVQPKRVLFSLCNQETQVIS